MKNPVPIISVIIAGTILTGGCGGDSRQKQLFSLPGEVTIHLVRAENKESGIEVRMRNEPFISCEKLVRIELYGDGEPGKTLFSGYEQISFRDDLLEGHGVIEQQGVRFRVVDHWSVDGGALEVERKVKVQGSLAGGFMSAICFTYPEPAIRESVHLFAPGMIYGTTDYLSEMAIGGSACTDFIRIREDRLPAPLFGAWFADGRSVTILNSRPDSRTIKEDSRDLDAQTIIDERLRFGAVGADFDSTGPVFGYWFPGTEGGITYRGRTYPYGQMRKWSRRYHPVKDGLTHSYHVSFRFSADDAFSDYYPGAWRWAWEVLRPGLQYHDMETVKRSLLEMLGERVESHREITGIRNYFPAPRGIDQPVARRFVMGFTGKALETASFLLAGSLEEDDPLGEKHRELGESIIHTFLELDLAPPEGEGFSFDGRPQVAILPPEGQEPVVYLRSFGDGLKSLLKAVEREQLAGHAHEEWTRWARSFADWLLPQQGDAGGFPRTWKQGTGEVMDPSPESSYTVIPYLVLLGEQTGDTRYVEAALKAGEFCWNTSQSKGVFIGGTIDNPNVIDKEAGTLSLEAYLSLYRHTSDRKWLERAVMAGQFAETWIYLWNVPMPGDELDSELHWKSGVPTTGMQLISTGHSLTDQYMSFDVNEFAGLYLNTGDDHFYDVARLLLHNTKSMLAIPGREFDLKGPGWQQEHWSLAPVRGMGIHRGWLPWVSTSHLNGIFELQELDPDLYREMTSARNLEQ